VRLLLDKSAFFELLAARGFTHLFHANSVETGLSFFSINSIGSRQFLENAKLPQSAQFTDSKDKQFGIWNDLFLNFHDHHRRFNTPNSFGPLCFRFPLTALKESLEKIGAAVSVSKKNAEKWSERDTPKERWVEDVQGLDSLFADPIVPGQQRGFFKNGLFPDIVISGTGALSLNLIDQVILEQHPSWPSHLDTLRSMIKEVWPKLYRRPEIVVVRSNCKTYCDCKKIESFSEKIESLFSFGSWKERYPQIFEKEIQTKSRRSP